MPRAPRKGEAGRAHHENTSKGSMDTPGRPVRRRGPSHKLTDPANAADHELSTHKKLAQQAADSRSHPPANLVKSSQSYQWIWFVLRVRSNSSTLGGLRPLQTQQETVPLDRASGRQRRHFRMAEGVMRHVLVSPCHSMCDSFLICMSKPGQVWQG